MKIQVLLATMFYEKESADFLDHMNVQTDMIIGDQCDKNEDAEIWHRGHKVTVLSRCERGVGQNRNTALLHSDADVVLFADNDVTYEDGYAQKVEQFYTQHPDADLVIFNFKEKRGDEPLHDIHQKNGLARLRDVTSFGAWAISAKRQSLLDHEILFSLSFGGGAKYSCGEDSLFLAECCQKGLRIYLCSETIGRVIHRESTWYHGITEKYVHDKGALLCAMSPKTYVLVIPYHAWKHRKTYRIYGAFFKTVLQMLKGARDYKKG